MIRLLIEEELCIGQQSRCMSECSGMEVAVPLQDRHENFTKKGRTKTSKKFIFKYHKHFQKYLVVN